MPSRYTAPSPGLRAWLLDELCRYHVGSAAAITWANLGGLAREAGFSVGADERNLREEVNVLQASDGPGALIVSSSRPPYGVYVAETIDEVRGSVAQLRSRIAALATKANHQEAAAVAEFQARATQPSLL